MQVLTDKEHGFRHGIHDFKPSVLGRNESMDMYLEFEHLMSPIEAILI